MLLHCVNKIQRQLNCQYVEICNKEKVDGFRSKTVVEMRNTRRFGLRAGRNRRISPRFFNKTQRKGPIAGRFFDETEQNKRKNGVMGI